MTTSAVNVVESVSQFRSLDEAAPASVVFFWADFHEPSKPGGQMDQVFGHLAERYRDRLCFCKAEAEAVSDLAERCSVAAVPTFAFLRDGVPIDKVEGADPAALAAKVEEVATKAAAWAAAPATEAGGSDTSLESRLAALVKQSYVMLFMKGSPDEPRCGFSRTAVGMLRDASVEFGSFDILSDQDVRAGLKEFSNWPTYPQLYVDGNLVGGLDILKEMAEEGDLKEQLGL